MRFADFVLRKTLSTNGIRQLLWTYIRRMLVRSFNDPPCTFPVHGRILHLPLSHELPTYLWRLPQYDRLPARLGAFLHTRYGPLRCLDIGSNIGDSIASFYRDERDQFLAIEPDPKFNHYLHQNWSVSNVTILNLACSDRSGSEHYEIDEKFGTASLRKHPDGIEIRTVTVDDLLLNYPHFSGLQLIKIDTDGDDFAVLSGARHTLTSQPAVLFECDVFGNQRYMQHCLETLAIFSQAGYSSMLVYEKFGYPMGRFELNDLRYFRDLLFYQLTKKFIYFDILIMKEQDLREFNALESTFFIGDLPVEAYSIGSSL